MAMGQWARKYRTDNYLEHKYLSDNYQADICRIGSYQPDKFPTDSSLQMVPTVVFLGLTKTSEGRIGLRQ
jgi:hypothetical protein